MEGKTKEDLEQEQKDIEMSAIKTACLQYIRCLALKECLFTSNVLNETVRKSLDHLCEAIDIFTDAVSESVPSEILKEWLPHRISTERIGSRLKVGASPEIRSKIEKIESMLDFMELDFIAKATRVHHVPVSGFFISIIPFDTLRDKNITEKMLRDWGKEKTYTIEHISKVGFKISGSV